MRIVCLNTFDKGDGVSYYRAKQPMDYLKSKGHDVVFVEKEDKVRLGTIIKDADILYVATPQGVSALNIIAEFVRQNLIEQQMLSAGIPKSELQEAGLSIKRLHIVIDFDDDVFVIPADNPAYKFRGRKEVLHMDPISCLPIKKHGKLEYIWQNGVDDFVLEKNKAYLRANLETLRLADLITSPSTVILKKLNRFALNGRTHLVPNGINTNNFKRHAITNDKIKLMWTLSSSHFVDWCALYPAISRVMKKFPTVELQTVGEKFPISHWDIPEDRWHHIPWVKVSEYGETISKLDCNVGIAHVIDSKFNRSKSPLKYQEYSMLGMVTLASKTLYNDYIEDKELVYINVEEFEEKLTAICEKRIDIVSLADKAYNSVSAKYSLNVLGDELEKTFEEMVAQ